MVFAYNAKAAGYLFHSTDLSVKKKTLLYLKVWVLYQQICLDATSLNAYGVGNYYIATEMELRAALVSYQQWKTFLLKYDEEKWMRRLRGPQKLFDAHVPARHYPS